MKKLIILASIIAASCTPDVAPGCDCTYDVQTKQTVVFNNGSTYHPADWQHYETLPAECDDPETVTLPTTSVTSATSTTYTETRKIKSCK